MKAISLWQPWATLIAIGAKRIETRHWPTNYRGPLAIHAAKRRPREFDLMCLEEGPIREALLRSGNLVVNDDKTESLSFYHGVVVAICRLSDCIQTLACGGSKALLADHRIVAGDEVHFGNYTPGRFAWILEEIEALERPVQCKGRQGLFNWERE